MAKPVVTVRLPIDLAEALPPPSIGGKEGRTTFIVEAIREKLEREEKASRRGRRGAPSYEDAFEA